MLTHMINFFYIFGLVCWIGSIIFFSFFAAPEIFKLLDREKAGEVVGVIFPRYYLLGYVCAALTLPSLLSSTDNLLGVKQTLLFVMTVGWLYACLFVSPKARDLKAKIKFVSSMEEHEPLEAQFKKMHSLVVKLNGAVLLAGLGLLWFSTAGFHL